MSIVVTPTSLAIRNGWDDSDRFEWPGTVMGLVPKPDKMCIQFLIWDKQTDMFVVKCWNRLYLEVNELQGDKWSSMDTGTWQNAIVVESLRHGINLTDCKKDALSSNAYRGKPTKKRRRGGRT